MGTKAVVGSLGLLALGTLASGSFLNINIWKNPFAGMSRSYSNTDSKGTDKKANTEEKKVEETVTEVVEERASPLATVEPVQEEVAPVINAQPKIEAQTVAPPSPVVEQQRSTPVQEPVKSVSAPSRVTKPVEQPKDYGGGSGQSQKPGSRSNGNGGFCVTPNGAYPIDDVNNCWTKYRR